MSAKNLARLRCARQTRIRIREAAAVRLTVHRTNAHIYAQITSPSGDKVIAAASTAEKEVRAQVKNGGNKQAAELVGTRIAAKAKQAGVETVAFDRGGNRYHGRVAAVAEGARDGGLQF